MSPPVLLYIRGAVYKIRFESDDPTRSPFITKYALCLQQGRILQNRHSFVGVLLTTCKDSNKPRLFPWTVYISPAESKTEFGTLINCGEIHTFPKEDVIEFAYALEADSMIKVNEALQFGIGTLDIETLKKQRENPE